MLCCFLCCIIWQMVYATKIQIEAGCESLRKARNLPLGFYDYLSFVDCVAGYCLRVGMGGVLCGLREGCLLL